MRLIMKLMDLSLFFCALAKVSGVNITSESSWIHPIEIENNHFVDSHTGERFFIRGIDYQPGGSAAYTRDSDPLSDVAKCARDIYLFQMLGVNTVRVYTVNPKLNHDECMTLLAAANIYLVLDVNSPLIGESINRYEPWTTYTPDYLRHVFEVVDQFSRYNNTLGLFIGNEIVNDERSSSVSPPYIRAVARDVKDYMYYNCPRAIPIGYSAADDLRYRKQLPHYLSCGDPETAIDFYGVNSYQWCGTQTIRTSGYDILIQDHSDFQIPIFFSEFGCNHILPRQFQEVEAIYSPAMTGNFDGALAYEYTQEDNNYGLVDIGPSGEAQIRGDFDTLKLQFAKAAFNLEKLNRAETAPSLDNDQTNQRSNSTAGPKNGRRGNMSSRSRTGACKSHYSNLSGASKDIPDSFGTDMIRNGVRVARGNYIKELLESPPESDFSIYHANGSKIEHPCVVVVNDFRDHIHDVVWIPRDGARSGTKNEAGSFDTGADSNSYSKSNSKKQNRREENKGSHSDLTSETLIIAAIVYTLLVSAL